MKQFVYTRLHERDQDYTFYVPPLYTTGVLGKAIASDMIDAKKKLLFLQRLGKDITFGVREQLTLRDERGRLITHFTGFQLEPHEGLGDIPYFEALERAFPVITQEAYMAHEILDSNETAGKKLQDTNIVFERGRPRPDVSWDLAIQQILDNPRKNGLIMCDERGKKLPLPPGIKSVAVSEPETVYRGEASRQGSDSFLLSEERTCGPHENLPGSASNFTGVKSSVTLSSHEQTYIPPLPDDVQDDRKRSLSDIWDQIWGIPRSVRDSTSPSVKPRKFNW